MNRNYALVTVVYNEADRIPVLVRDVAAQTERPLRWLIVSDGSTDGTDEAILSASARHPWIEFARQEKCPEDAGRLEKVTIAQARAMALALEKFRALPYAFLGNLDADVALPPNYYARVIDRMMTDSSLGIAGGAVRNVAADGSPLPGGFIKTYFVGGPVQLFRRECVEALGGYAPYGHSDVIAVARARMMGWKVRCFPDITAGQLQVPANTIREKVPVCYRMGRMDYLMGDSPLFELLRGGARMARPPYVIAGAALLAGFFRDWLARKPIPVPPDVVAFMRREQWRKIRRFWKGPSTE